MRFAIVGCGYVADFYAATCVNHPNIELVAVFDRVPERMRAFACQYQAHCYNSLDELLEDPNIELVANLTNPTSHYEVSRAALKAGKHVYSEKPLALDLDEATALVEYAEKRDLLLASAPCSILGETAQTIWRALRENLIGTPRLVYAELDDGNVPEMNYSKWISQSGALWPAKDEFEVGCTLEHAGYYLTWLTAFFGPVRRMTAFSHNVQPDKGISLDICTPDYATAGFEFQSGVFARLTCSIFAPHDHRLRIFGDKGRIETESAWSFGGDIHATLQHSQSERAERHPKLAKLLGFGPRRLPLVRKADFVSGGYNRMDFCRGIAEIADAINEGRAPRLSARWSLHVNELVLAMQDPERYGVSREIGSTFPPMEPMPWS
jgi:predicted dehydrogenase